MNTRNRLEDLGLPLYGNSTGELVRQIGALRTRPVSIDVQSVVAGGQPDATDNHVGWGTNPNRFRPELRFNIKWFDGTTESIRLSRAGIPSDRAWARVNTICAWLRRFRYIA